MSNDTICTQEQPCGKQDCSYCDPFADAAPAIPQAFPAGSNVATTHSYPERHDAWTAPPPSETPNPIPSLSACYVAMQAAYLEYEEKVSALALAEQHAVQDKIDLEAAKTAVLLKYTDPKELGSNEAQRTAAIAFHVSHQTAKLQAATASVELLKCETEVARIRCRFQDNTLRFCEALLMQQDNDRSE